MAEKLSRRLVLLSSAAIAAVYAAGVLETRSADAGLAAVAPVAAARTPTLQPSAASEPATAAAAAPPPAPSSTPVPIVTPVPAATATARPSTPTAAPPKPAAVPPTAVPTATPAQAATGYRNGSYSGLGTSRRGDIQVRLTIAGGRITNVAITDATTQYPLSWIRALPQEVVATQQAPVDLVSGATYSSLAFSEAVQQALAQAQGQA